MPRSPTHWPHSSQGSFWKTPAPPLPSRALPRCLMAKAPPPTPPLPGASELPALWDALCLGCSLSPWLTNSCASMESWLQCQPTLGVVPGSPCPSSVSVVQHQLLRITEPQRGGPRRPLAQAWHKAAGPTIYLVRAHGGDLLMPGQPSRQQDTRHPQSTRRCTCQAHTSLGICAPMPSLPHTHVLCRHGGLSFSCSPCLSSVIQGQRWGKVTPGHPQPTEDPKASKF